MKKPIMKKQQMQQLAEKNKGTPEQEEKCRKLANEFGPETHTMRIRDTYKKNPTLEKGSGVGYVQCDFCDYETVYLGCFENHLKKKHLFLLSKFKLQTLLSSIVN
jgi:hypothetical protein